MPFTKPVPLTVTLMFVFTFGEVFTAKLESVGAGATTEALHEEVALLPRPSPAVTSAVIEPTAIGV
jgi:hypothetical protein